MPQTAGAKLAFYLIGSLLIIVTIVGLAWSRGYWKERSENADVWIEAVRAVSADITENKDLKREDVAVQIIEHANHSLTLNAATSACP